jgi:3-phosphoshikimate 1-carboxyvinyltransferase
MSTAGSPRAVEPVSAPLDATIRLPGSKSITNRALVCAALADGRSHLRGVLAADDTEAMLDNLERLGFVVSADVQAASVAVSGVPAGPEAGPVTLDARLSGTTSRFLLALLAIGRGPYLLDGAEPLRARPMADGIAALEALGVTLTHADEAGHLPVTIEGPATGAEVRLRADASSQFASGLLLSAPALPHGLTVRLDGPIVSQPYLDLTVAVMAAFGVQVERPDARTYVVPPGPYRATDYDVEPDASAASYFFAAAAVAGGRVRVEGLGRDAIQGDMAFVDVLERMGATVERGEHHTEVRSTGVLHGVEADLTDFSDTAQTLAATAVFADSPTTITGIGFIRRKETDRIGAVATELRRCGIEVDELDDGLRVHPGVPKAAIVKTYDDHRMAMSFALLGLRAPGIEIDDPGCVKKSFPAFWDVFDSLPSGGNAASRFPDR